jgi:hypothetical protein
LQHLTSTKAYVRRKNIGSGLEARYIFGKIKNDIMIKNGTGNYFERGKHANECHNKFNDSL